MKLRFPQCQPPQLPNSLPFWRHLGLGERTALFVGLGFGSGFLKPGPGTWGSLVGFLYSAGILWLPLPWAIGGVLCGLAVSIWSAGISERLLQKKDPGEVVIDEIVSIPLALWPLYGTPHPAWWVWVAAFAVFRFLDIAKPFPIKQLQRFRGGFGILIDDVAAALFTSVVVWFLVG